jgi:dihydroorotate dehydrogenase (fumarate)
MEKRNIIAVCGPSGVGKGYTKNLIQNINGVSFVEPVVATTRPIRSDDGVHRLAGLTDKEFADMVETGLVVLPHQPFGDNTAYYGFIEESFKNGNILAEVHSSILKEFREYFKNDNLLIFAMEASDDFLRESMKKRGTNTDIDLRVAKNKEEVAQIREARQNGIIDGLWNIDLRNRVNSQSQIVNQVKKWLKKKPYIQIQERNESMDNNELRTSFLGTQFNSPLVVASGDLTETPEQIDEFIKAGAGAVIPRTTRLKMIRDKHPTPNLYQRGGSLINAQWTGADIDYWRPYLEGMSENKDKIIMSVSGRNIEDCVKVCKELDIYRFPAIEINISCAASSGVHGQITKNIDFVKTITKRIKDACVKTPISLKLGHSDAILEIANAAKESGADAITAINTVGPVFDFTIGKNGQPQRVVGIEGSKGGLSGKAIFNTALTDVAEISKQVKVPVMASGGVMSAEDAVKMIMSGASLVQLYTKLHNSGIHAQKTLADFNTELLRYLQSKNIQDISSIKGKALYLLDLPTDLIAKIPQIDYVKCTGCKLCRQVCLNGAIDTSSKEPQIIENNCKSCGHCVSVCPTNALSQGGIK